MRLLRFPAAVHGKIHDLVDDNNVTDQIKSNGYQISHAEYIVERKGERTIPVIHFN
jgi:hypothetical protein